MLKNKTNYQHISGMSLCRHKILKQNGQKNLFVKLKTKIPKVVIAKGIVDVFIQYKRQQNKVTEKT